MDQELARHCSSDIGGVFNEWPQSQPILCMFTLNTEIS